MKRRTLLSAAAAALGSAVLSACGGEGSGATDTADAAKQTSEASPAKARALATTQPSGFYGVNAHYFQGGVYAGNLWAQSADCQGMWLTFVRQDCYAGDQTTIASTLVPDFAPVVVQPIFNTLPDHTKSETHNYNTFHVYGVAYATALAGLVPVIELLNEPENEYFAGYAIGGNGQNVTDFSSYPSAYWAAFRGACRGFVDGWRSVDTTKQTLIASPGMAWMHYGILSGLMNGEAPDGTIGHPTCSWDITNQHWYMDDGDITAINFGGGNIVNLLALLQSTFGLPIQLSEIGVQYAQTEAVIDAYIASSIAQYASIASTYNIVGAAWYELYNFDNNSGFYMGLNSAIGTANAGRDAAMLAAIQANPM